MAFLEVNNFQKSFGNTKVLKDISFEMEKGEVLAIIGSSGSGKTTLLRCMNFLTEPEQGSMSVNEEVILNMADKQKKSEEELRKNRLHFGLVFQQFNLFPQYTVRGNLMLASKLYEEGQAKKLSKGLRSEYLNRAYSMLEKKANALLARVGLTEKADSYPCELSGGQKQRVAIARALMMSPDILCFDEPTSALDPELTGEVLNVIKGLKSGDCTMVVVTHEMEFARNVADKVIFMANGVIEEMGTPEEIFNNPKSSILKSFLNKALD